MITLARIIEALEPRALTRIPAAVLAREVTAVTADSRRVVPGSLFVAVRGEKADGRVWEGAEGLEWELPSPPPHHSWETQPVVK